MKKKNFKKPLLVCLSVLTLFSASATSIASSVIDNQPKVVHRVKRANEVNGASYQLVCGKSTWDLKVNTSNNQEVMLTGVYFTEGEVLSFKKKEGSSTWNHGIQLKDGVDKTKVSLSSDGLNLTIKASGYYSFYLDASNGMLGLLWCSQDEAVTLSNEVTGQFNVTADLAAPLVNDYIIFDAAVLCSEQTPLSGETRVAFILVGGDEQLHATLTGGDVYPGVNGVLASGLTTFYNNDIYATVFYFDRPLTGNEFSIDFGLVVGYKNFDVNSLYESIVNGEINLYGGYFGQTRQSVITVKNIPGMEVEEDISGPLISGSQRTYTTSVDNPISVETIKSALTAQDETDGNVTASIVIKSDNYTNNSSKLGSYDIVFAAYDAAGNESTLTVTVIVQDLVDPVITGPDTLTISYSNPKTLEDIKSQYAVTDNYDTSISIEVDAQSPNYDGTKVGTYSITLKAKDSSNHVVRKTITVNVVDDVAPVFSGASSFVTNNSTSASLDDVMANCNIKATDEISGECEVRIKSETLTGNADKVGNYEVVYEATDAAGNTSEFKVSVSITDGIPPVFYIDNTVIYAANDIMMTNVDLCNLMIATCEIDASKPYSLSITDADGYLAACAEGKEVPLGEYEVTATVSYKDGNKDVYTKTISVYDSTSSDLEFEEVKLNFFEAIGQFFKNWKAAWNEGGFKLWWQKLFNGDLFTENMTKIVEVEKEVENKTSETSGK